MPFSPSIRIGDKLTISIPGSDIVKDIPATVDDVITCNIARSVGVREVIGVIVTFDGEDVEPFSIYPDWIKEIN